MTGTPRELASEARLALYRTAQEALTNVLRHSAADRVELGSPTRRTARGWSSRTTAPARR